MRSLGVPFPKLPQKVKENEPADAEPNPASNELTAAQQERVFELLRAIVDGKAPITLIDVNWSLANRRAVAEKSTMSIPGLEAVDIGGTRAKPRR